MKNKLEKKTGIRLDVGGGANPQPGFVNMDYRKLPGVDIVHNLEKFPWPLKDESVLIATASHVIEHINPAGGTFLKFMDECWRVLKPGGEFLISCPYATSPGMFRDPTHCNFVNEETFSYLDPYDPFYNGQLYAIYKPKPWQIKPNTLSWHDNGNLEVVLVKRQLNYAPRASQTLTGGIKKASKKNKNEKSGI